MGGKNSDRSGGGGSSRLIMILVFFLTTEVLAGRCMADISDFFGAYEGFSQRCGKEMLVLNATDASILDCARSQYTIIENSDNYIMLKLISADECPTPFLKLEKARDFPESKPLMAIIVTGYDNINSGVFSRHYFLTDYDVANDPLQIFLNSHSGEERAKALQAIHEQEESVCNRYDIKGVDDLSPEVRKIAYYSLYGDPELFIQKKARAMVHDPDREVRKSAAYSLSSNLTDNGANECPSIGLIVENLDYFLTALNDPDIERPVANILGARYSGETVLPCCMPHEARSRVLVALQERSLRARGYALQDMNEAIIHVKKCTP